MKFVAIDLELNQPSNRIIQIGAAWFDTDSKTPYTPVHTLSLFVNPGEPINYDYQLESGGTLGELLGLDWSIGYTDNVPTAEAISNFWTNVRDLKFGKRIVQWGKGDLSILTKETKDAGLNFPNGLVEIDLKKLYVNLYSPALELKGRTGLSGACKSLGLEFEGRAHDALVDAINTGRLYVRMYEIVKAAGPMLKISLPSNR